MARVVLVSEHAYQREALFKALRERTDIVVAGVAADLRTGLSFVLVHRPDALLIDNPSRGLIDELNTQPSLPCPTVLAGLCPDSPPELGVAMHQLVFVKKHCSLEELGRTLTWSPQQHRGTATARCADHTRQFYLTERQRTIANLVAEGLSNREIARHLFISVATVKNHLHQILSKLGLNRRSQLVRLFSSSAGGASYEGLE